MSKGSHSNQIRTVVSNCHYHSSSGSQEVINREVMYLISQMRLDLEALREEIRCSNQGSSNIEEQNASGSTALPTEAELLQAVRQLPKHASDYIRNSTTYLKNIR